MLDNGILRASKKIILGLGVLLAMFGFVVLGTELWRTFTGLNEIRVKYLVLAAAVLLSGLFLIQTLNPAQLFRSFMMFLANRYPGGRRATDPPPDDAPPAVPREKWPPSEPTWRPKQRPRGD